jgi:hypothetical protein
MGRNLTTPKTSSELMKKSLERCRSASFQPATSLDSIKAGKMPALQRASWRLFHQPGVPSMFDSLEVEVLYPT